MLYPRRLVAKLAGACAALGVALVSSGAMAQGEFPEAPLTVIVPSAAGGGTDASVRILAKGLEDELGVPVNVVNRSPALPGHLAIINAEPDGYTIGAVFSVIGKFHWLGEADVSYEDLTPLIHYNLDAAGVVIDADDERFASLEDLLAQMRSDPSALMASGGAVYGAWHTAWLQLLQDHDIPIEDVRFIPSRGAAPALAELAGGGIDVAPVSVVEARGLADAGEVEVLAFMGPERHPLFPEVPTVGEITGTETVAGAWRGIAGPAGIPEDRARILEEALTNVYESEAFQNQMERAGFGLLFRDSEAFAEFLAENDAFHGRFLKTVGAIEG